MKRSWRSHLFISLSIGLLACGSAGAVTTETITACTACHSTNPQTPVSPVDGTARNSPEGATLGSHEKHVPGKVATCAGCHVMPGTTAYDHRDGYIDMQASISGGPYSLGTHIHQDNQLTTSGMGTCTNTCHTAVSPVWGVPATCDTCHGYPPVTTGTLGVGNNKHVSGATAVNHIGTGSTVNTAATFVSEHGGCQICHGTESTTGLGSGTLHNPYITYTTATQHATGNINMNGPTTALATKSAQYDPSIRGCLAACHGSAAPYRMTASNKTLYYDMYGPGGDCISCHTVAVSAPKATTRNAAVTTRPAIIADFNLTSRHIRSRTASTAVTKYDCCVCHMEGDVTTGGSTAFHKDGYINLRDPDTGLNIKGVTHNGTTATAGTYTSTAVDAAPVRFSRNLGSATIEPDTAAIMVNHCLNCHDTDGASNAAGRLPTSIQAGATAGRPFGAAIAANPSSNVLDIASQFASTNRSFHPVLARNNSGYTNTGGSRLIAPWNAVTKTGTTGIFGPLITCWDCHAPNNTASTVTLTTTGIHGEPVSGADVVQLRGNVYLSGTTVATNLCLHCHTSLGTSNHGTGSAVTSATSGSMTYFANRCYFCHSSVDSNAHAARPRGAGDAHGYNANADGTAIATAGRGYAFIRRLSLPQIVRSVSGTAYTPTCGTATGTCSRSMGTYLPGGVY